MKKIFTLSAILLLFVGIGWFVYSKKFPQNQAMPIVKVGIIYKGKNFKKVVDGFQSGLSQSVPFGKKIEYILKDVSGVGQKDFDLVAQGLVADKVDLIFAVGAEPITAAKKFTAENKTPVVLGLGANPVSLGFVKNLQKPEGNITGVSWQVEELSGKRMEFLKMIAPRIKRVTLFREKGTYTMEGSFKYIDPVKENFGLVVTVKEFSTLDEFKNIILSTTAKNTDAIFYAPDPFVSRNAILVIQQALKEKIPTMWPDENLVRAGGTASYGASFTSAGMQASRLAKKILFEGKSPSDIPLEVVSKVDFVINLVSAKKIGLVVPEEAISIADTVIQE